MDLPEVVTYCTIAGQFVTTASDADTLYEIDYFVAES